MSTARPQSHPDPAIQGGAERGQAVYTPLTLAFYDLAVLGVSNPLIWRCPTPRILELYRRHVTDDHLDVGVGTGWYLDRCGFPGERPRIGLLDLNPHALAAATRRLTRYRPETYRADVLRPVHLAAAPFRSASMTYLLHCLPGGMAEKGRALDTLTALLDPDGVLFGATLLAAGLRRSGPARALMAAYNRVGIFSNTTDSLDALTQALRSRFADVDVDVVGCAALFVARRPTRAADPMD